MSRHPTYDNSTNNPVSTSKIRKELKKILASTTFVHSERLSRFLDFIAGMTLQDRGNEIKEYLIGLEVFDRPSSYDPRVDPIVRVQAGRLRLKLKEYYEHQGKDDEVVVTVPKGRYVPSFRVRKPVVQGRAALGPTPIDNVESKSIAVLPFTNISADPENEYFSDGLTEELINTLARVPGLHVVARTSVFQFKGKARDIRQIGKQLGVGKVLEGCVRRSGNRLRITAQLINVVDGCHLWSDRFDRQVSDIFVIQDEISEAIREALRIRLAAPKKQVLSGPPTLHLEAYNHYLKGRFQWNKRTEEGLRAGIQHFEWAIREDRRYVRAYSGLADCRLMLAMSGAVSPEESMPQAKDAAVAALGIDDRLAEAHNSLAAVRTNYEWSRLSAEQAFGRALELDPNYATVHHWYGLFFLGGGGRLDDALDHMLLAQRLDPFSLPINADLGLLYYFRREYDLSISQCRRTMELYPDFHRAYWFLGLCHERQRSYEEAAAAFQKALSFCGGSAFRSRIMGALGHCYARWGKHDRAGEVLRELQQFSKTRYVPRFDLAYIYAGLDEKNRALLCLEKAVQNRSSFLIFLKPWPVFEDLHSDPRFPAILSQLGL